MTTISAPTTTPSSTVGISRLYLVRAVIALLWAGLFVATASGPLTSDQTIPTFAVALLIIYPLIDVAASLVDARTSRHDTSRHASAQFLSAAISAVAAAAIAVAAGFGADAILRVFGIWALLTGLIQLILAVVRRRRGTPGQLAMMFSGSISAMAGIAFILMATEMELNLTGLAAYATAGAIFFLLAAWRLRAQSDTTA